MIKFHVMKHGWKFLFFILWIGVDVQQNVCLAADDPKAGPSGASNDKLIEITSEIVIPWRVLSDDAINYFVKFANEAQQRMPTIKKKYKLLEVTVTQVPAECKSHAKVDEDDVQIMYGGWGGDVGGENSIGHYICIHYLHELRQVHVYDSLLGTSLYPRQMKVLEVLYPSLDFTKPNTLKFVRPRTTQYDSSSCGVFSIAYATTIIFEKDPQTYILELSTVKLFFQSSIDYSVSLRKHLIRMLKSGNLSIFPEGDPAKEPIIPIPTPRPVSVYRESSIEKEPIIDTTTFGYIDKTTYKSHTFVAKLYFKRKDDDSFYRSTATILSPTKLVTAAQNVANSAAVYLSFMTLTPKDNKHRVDVNIKSEIFIHPRYDESSAYANDVAVIILKKPFTAASEIKMVDKKYSVLSNNAVTMLGFSTKGLGYINTTVSNFISCRHVYYKKNKQMLDEGKQFCVNTGNNHISIGWVGGPIVTGNKEFVGIMSYDYRGLPKVCTLATGTTHEFISNPKSFIAKNKIGFPFLKMMM